MKIKDIKGDELKVGDIIIKSEIGYNALYTYIIIGLTPKGIRISKINKGKVEKQYKVCVHTKRDVYKIN